MAYPCLAVILVNWNGKMDTLECLASLRQDEYENKRIIVVDNGSTDDSVVVFRAQFPEITVLEAGTNSGFTGGNNLGIRHALAEDTKYVFLLNNDTTVEPTALTALVQAAQTQQQYGLLTPVIHYFDRPTEPWFAGSLLDLSCGIAVHDNRRIPAPDEAPFPIPWASGCAMLLPADILRELGGFDERYFLNWEDVDLSLRVAALNYQIGVVPAARIYHKVGRSLDRAGSGLYYHVRNNLLLVTLHAGPDAHRATLRVLKGHIRAALRDIKHKRSAGIVTLITTLRAINHHYRRHYGAIATPNAVNEEHSAM